MKNKTILQILPELNSGGVERGTVDLSCFLKEKGFNSIVVSNGGALVSKIESCGVKHIRLNVHSKNPINVFLNIFHLRRVIKEHKVDIIHARSRIPAIISFFAKIGTKVKFITTFHGLYSISGIIKKFYNSFMLKSDKIVAVSNFVKNHIMENYQIEDNKITVIQRGVDVNFFSKEKANIKSEFILKLNLNKNNKIFFMPSRYTDWKGHKDVIIALSKITNYLCIFAGKIQNHDGYYHELISLTESLGVKNNFIFLDTVDDFILRDLYAISDFIICASKKKEAFGRIPIEAQSMEKIVISTDSGGPKESIVNNHTGFIVQDTLLDTINYALSLSDIELKKIELNARKNAVENFSLQKMLNKYLELYE
jgi:glycosyltransferase involved in cell wall biosynthesis